MRSLFQDPLWNSLLIILACYLIGSFPPAVIAGKIKGNDILKVGSRNAGAMNTFISVGKAAGSIIVTLHIGKGFLVAFCDALFFDPLGQPSYSYCLHHRA